MPSYVGACIAWKDGEMTATALTVFRKDVLPIHELEAKLLEWALDRWSPSKGWKNHSAHITLEISREAASVLLEHAREKVDVFV